MEDKLKDNRKSLLPWSEESTELVNRIQDAIRRETATYEDTYNIDELAYVVQKGASSAVLDIMLEQKYISDGN